MKKKERRRVDASRVKSNAAEGSGGGISWLRLPKGVESFRPERAGAMRLDIVPYEVKSSTHPDRVEPGTLWYKYPFAVHYGVGVNNESVACPVSVGKRCPLCEQRAKLAKNWDENETTVRALTPQRWVAYNIVDPEDSDKICVFVFSRGKFAEFFESEILEGDEANLNFYDVTADGRTVKVRFTEDQFEGRKYLKATRIDFIPRPAMDEDEILSKVACLDEIFVVYEYEQLERMFGGDAVETVTKPVVDDGDDEEDVPVKSKSKVADEYQDDEEEDDDEIESDDDEEEDEALVKAKKPVKKVAAAKPVKDKRPVKKTSPPPPDDDEEEEEEDVDFDDDEDDDDR